MLFSSNCRSQLDSNVLNDLHWSTQLLPNAPMRSLFLVYVGISTCEFPQHHSEDALDKRSIIRGRNAQCNLYDTQTHIYAENMGCTATSLCSKRGLLMTSTNLSQCIRDAVSWTPEWSSRQAFSLTNLGNSLWVALSTRDLGDLNTSVSVLRTQYDSLLMAT